MRKNFELWQQLQQKLDRVAMMEQVGIFPVVRNKRESCTKIVRLDPNRTNTEELRKLVENVFLSRGKLSPRLVVFTAPDCGECCSRLIAEVAVTLALAEVGKVCLVDAYFHSPCLSEYFDLGNPCGLTEASRLSEPILDFTIPVRTVNLSLLAWASSDAGAESRLPMDDVKKWLDELCLRFDYVLVNAPPLDQFADGIAFGHLADGLVLVLDRSSTEPASALKHLQRLRESRVRVRLAILNYRAIANGRVPCIDPVASMPTSTGRGSWE
jgi:Mrp family chromosome partitioning ATPase